MLDPQSYEVAEPLVQMKGIDPVTNSLSFYKVDQNGELIYRFNFDTEGWDYFLDAGPFPVPSSLQSAISGTEKKQLEEYILNSGWFKVKTSYIYFGDESWQDEEVVIPLKQFIGQAAYDKLIQELRASGMSEDQIMQYTREHLLAARTQVRSGAPAGVIDIAAKLGPEKVAKFKQLFKFFPRAFLRKWYDDNIAGKIGNIQTHAPGANYTYSGNQMVWGAIVDLFNEANLEHITEIGYSPWQWEQEKLQTYYMMENKKVLEELNARFESYKQLNSYPDPQATALMIEYKRLPPIGDLGLEISRQAVIKELLARKEYATVKGIIDAYRLADTTILGEAVRNKIPFDINAKQGRSVKAST